MELNEQSTIKDILIHAKNEKHIVDLILGSGKMYTGLIKAVGQFAIVLEQKGQRSYYDAFIRIEDISVVEMKMRS